jgi:hypothetical protein
MKYAAVSVGASLVLLTSGIAFAQSTDYSASLTGNKEVPSVHSGVTGDMSITNNNSGDFSYQLNVRNGQAVTEAHLHCAPPGENGPVVVKLYENEKGQNINGRLASGSITDSKIENSAQFCANTIGHSISSESDLIDAMNNGQIYVNVHSAPYPNGAARGQINVGSANSNQ